MSTAASSLSRDEVLISAAGVELPGTLVVPENASGVVVFASGSGSSRGSLRSQFVARALEQRGLATLLFDLLTAEEERTDALVARLRFDIPLLAARLANATDWLRHASGVHDLPVGYLGAGTGAAAALIAAALEPGVVSAVVSRSGRPDLAEPALPMVQAPTLLIVGGDDPSVRVLNRRAAARMKAPHQTVVVPGATHSFEESGALEEVARLAAGWFVTHLNSSLWSEPIAP